LARCKKYRLASLATGALLMAALAGCYNPRFPSESPTASPPPENQQDSSRNHVVRDRRDGAAGSGSSTRY
jgi:hypothetical protein